MPDGCLVEVIVKNREQLKTLTFVATSRSLSITSLIDLDRFRNLHHPLPVTVTQKFLDSLQIAVGDIVVVYDEERPPGFWRLASADDLARGASIRMKCKNHRYSTLRRPTQLLYSLGLKSEDESVASDDYGNPAMSHAGEGFQQPFEPSRNPRRAVAVESQRRRRAWIEKFVWFAWLVELQTSPKSCFPSYLKFACRDLCWPVTQRFSVFLYWSKSGRMLG